MSNDETQERLLRQLIRRQLIERGRVADPQTIDRVYKSYVAKNPGPWFDEVKDPELIKQLSDRLKEKNNERH